MFFEGTVFFSSAFRPLALHLGRSHKFVECAVEVMLLLLRLTILSIKCVVKKVFKHLLRSGSSVVFILKCIESSCDSIQPVVDFVELEPFRVDSTLLDFLLGIEPIVRIDSDSYCGLDTDTCDVCRHRDRGFAGFQRAR